MQEKTENKLHKNSLYILAENKLGALDRIIGCFTLRGYKITNLIYSQNKNPNFVDLKLTLNCNDNELEKLVKILHNQINILEIRLIMDDKDREPAYIAIAG